MPAEMVFFQGPHFGDRYGILDAAVRGLAARRVKMTAAACSGACIYIVLPEGKSEGAAVAALSEVFEIPPGCHSESINDLRVRADERKDR